MGVSYSTPGGQRLFSTRVGLLATALYVTNGRLLATAAGRLWTDHPDSIVTSLVLLGMAVGVAQVHSQRRTWAAVLGLLAGLAFAIWARVHIGRNWGVPMTRKPDPELVTTGPYHLVRHPIYSGILLGGLGTAIALGWFWFIAVGIMGVYFFYSATVEERFMTSQFPDAYPAYKRSTKMLLPFVL